MLNPTYLLRPRASGLLHDLGTLRGIHGLQDLKTKGCGFFKGIYKSTLANLVLMRWRGGVL